MGFNPTDVNTFLESPDPIKKRASVSPDFEIWAMESPTIFGMGK